MLGDINSVHVVVVGAIDTHVDYFVHHGGGYHERLLLRQSRILPLPVGPDFSLITM
jgi:hypothetical protein